MVVERCLPKVSGNTGRTYVRRSIRNALANLKRAMSVRMPRDARGRTQTTLSLDGILPDAHDDGVRRYMPTSLVSVQTPERSATAAELISALEVMPESDRQLLYEAFVDGVHHRHSAERLERVRLHAESILTCVISGSRDERTKTMAKEIPDCHTEGSDPIGYETDPKEAEQCQNCLDKFTCLPQGIKTGFISGVDLSIDPEVKAFVRGVVPVAKLRARIEKRQELAENNKIIPSDLLFDNIPEVGDTLNALSNDVGGALYEGTKTKTTMEDSKMTTEKSKKSKKSKTEPTAAPTLADAMAPKKAKGDKPKKPKAPEVTADDAGDPPPPVKKGKKKDKPKTDAEKAPAPKAPKAAKAEKSKKPKAEKAAPRSKGEAPNNRGGEKGTFKYPGKPKEREDGSVELPNGRTIPAPKKIASEKMTIALERLNGKLGLNFDLAPGMKLTQERRDGENVVIAIKNDGFYVGESPYASLTAACMAAINRNISGTEMFNFGKHHNIVVSGKTVPNGKYRKNDAE